jgi:UrcA family protein
MFKSFSAGSAALAFCMTVGVIGLLAQPAAAANTSEVAALDRVEVSTRVSTAGLDLAKSDDVRMLEARVRAATRRLCDQESRGVSRSELSCKAAARTSAERQITSLVDRSQRRSAASQSMGSGTKGIASSLRGE